MLGQYIVSSFINIAATIYCVKKITTVKLNLKDPQVYIFYLIWVMVGSFAANYINFYTRMSLMTIMLFAFAYYVLKNRRSALIISLFVQIILCISEVVGVVAFLMLFYRGNIDYEATFFGSIVMNVLISFVIIGISNFKVLNTYYEKTLNLVRKIKNYHIALITITIIMIFLFLSMSFYFDINSVVWLIMNLIFFVIYSITTVVSVNQTSQNIKYKDQNKYLSDSLLNYEKIFTNERMVNHENKNQFLILKELIKNQDPETLKYINAIIKDNQSENNLLYSKVKRIPSGGLQGLVYKKVILMNDKNIKCIFHIDRAINSLSLSKLSPDDNYDLCRIVGVILDNAVEASETSILKEVSISMHESEGIIFEVANFYNNLNQINGKFVSTKDASRGHGLLLMKKIIKNNPLFENETIIDDNIFRQIIKIKNVD